ncbi:MAG: hypothetical protein ABR528_14220 [Pseudonocardiaceae bacterium]
MPDVPAVVKLVVGPWAGAGPEAAVHDGLGAVLNPPPCWALCPGATLRAVVLVAGKERVGEELELPRSACGANPLPTVDEWVTVVVKGCEVTWDFIAEFIGVVVTGWLGTALPVVMTAAFTGAVAAFTGSFSVGAKDGARPAAPLVARLEKPGKPAAGEYGAAAPGSADITWCSAACSLVPKGST